MKVIDLVKEMAYSNIANLTPVSSDPIESLLALDWNIMVSDEPINQAAVMEANLKLETTFCLGRAAMAAAFVESWFPNCKLQYGEVLEDMLRNIMLESLSNPPLESELLELLSYEDPHAVIIIDDVQFDPLSAQLGIEIIHPKIRVHPTWNGFASNWLVEKSKFSINPMQKVTYLVQAEDICSGTSYAAEHRLYMCMNTLGQERYIDREFEQVLEMRPTARTLFTSAILGNKTSEEKFLKIYPVELYDLLTREVASLL